MKEQTSEATQSTSANDSVLSRPYAGYVGLDVHKDSIAVAVAYAGREAPKSLGTIPVSYTHLTLPTTPYV